MPRPFLVFTLAGPMAAWGDVAVGESRPTFARPSKSAVLGLVAAALGLTRNEEAGHQALREGYGLAVWPLSAGHLLLDYHTAQVPTGTASRGLPTRRDELAQTSINTTLSTRAYRTDAFSVVALWTRGGARWNLDRLAAALLQPAFPLFLGRRSCPPSLPLMPRQIEAETLADALMAYEDDWPDDSLADLVEGPFARTIYSDPDGPGLPANADASVRRDDPVHRGRRAFADRREIQTDLPDR